MAIFSQINSGDIIATSREYMEHSGRNNVHIELYENGTLIDPLEKLDLSNVQTHTIPARYGWKYIDDSKNMRKTIDTKTLQKNI
jgi:hypothetical protein